MKLEELKVYEPAMDLGEDVWDVVDRWNFFKRIQLAKCLINT